MRRLLLALLLLQLTGCSGLSLPSLGFYPVQLDNSALHAEVFTESYRRITTYYLEPVNLAQLVPEGLEGLKQIDPTYTPAIASAPAADDWKDWGPVTLASIKAAQTHSAKLAAAKPDDIYNAFFPAMLSHLDGFSHYVPPMDADADERMRDGYGGIGVTFERRGPNFAIVDTFIGSPAAIAGLRAGEIVHAINGQPTGSMSTNEFADQVRGPVGTTLTLTVAAPGQPMRDVRVTRAQVIPTTVSLHMERSVAVIRISRFMPSTVREFRQAAQQALWNHATAVVLDMQHNPGGILESATEIAGLLLPRGVIASTNGRHPDSRHAYNTSGADILNGLRLYILMDGHSASAAEVLAAALHDRHRATLIGSTSYGKASVQNVGPLPHGGELAITWAKLLGPAGETWMPGGIAPDICVLQQSPCPKADDVEALALPKALELARQ